MNEEKKETIMVCSRCGHIIEKTKCRFDIYDCSWTCPHCSKTWFSSDSWKRVGNLLIPCR